MVYTPQRISIGLYALVYAFNCPSNGGRNKKALAHVNEYQGFKQIIATGVIVA